MSCCTGGLYIICTGLLAYCDICAHRAASCYCCTVLVMVKFLTLPCNAMGPGVKWVIHVFYCLSLVTCCSSTAFVSYSLFSVRIAFPCLAIGSKILAQKLFINVTALNLDLNTVDFPGWKKRIWTNLSLVTYVASHMPLVSFSLENLNSPSFLKKHS